MDFVIENFSVKPLQNGEYIRAYLATYKINGESRDWELIKVGNSVAILIYNRSSNSFVLVKQFRPALYFNHKINYTYELCAGLVDKDLTLKEIASEEVLEETGFKVSSSDLKKITSFYTSVGSSGSRQHLYYVEVDESCRLNSGGGVEGEEMIEVVEIPVESSDDLIYSEEIATTPGLMFAFEWFKNNRS